MKKCTKCSVDKEDCEFFKRAKSRDGLQAQCKTCSKAIYKYPYKPLTEDQKISSYAKNKQSRILNREKYLWRLCKDRSTFKGIDFDLEISDIFIPEYCPVLGIKLTSGKMSFGDPYAPSVDRIDNSKGYVKGNIMVISRRANTMKNCASKEELKSFCEFFLKLINENGKQE